MPPGSGDQGDWRTDPSKQAADLRLTVLVAEATISHRLAEDGYLSARQLWEARIRWLEVKGRGC
jgi:hypothetical protein